MAGSNTITWRYFLIDNLQLRTIFTRFGLPDTVVTDNGTALLAVNLNRFYQKVVFITGKQTMNHPASNGLVERAVHILKQGLKN